MVTPESNTLRVSLIDIDWWDSELGKGNVLGNFYKEENQKLT